MTATFPLPIDDIIAGLNEIIENCGHCNDTVQIGTVSERVTQRIEDRALGMRNMIVALRDAGHPTPVPSLGGDCVAVPRERLLKLLEYSDAEYVPNALFSEFRIYLGTAIPAASISSPDGAAEQRDTIAALTICDAMFKWMIAHGLATIDTDYTAADVVTILDDLLITVKPLPSDGLDDCFRHHIVTTIGWPAFSMRPGREMQMYEEGFKAGYRRCQSDNAEEFGEGEDWFTKRTQRVVAKLRESLKAGEVDPLAIDNAVDLLIDQSKALALANPTPAPREAE